uniref:Uncharacterized protein n=1 Tax=Pristionchus pacificus TaxID=54126 RepID=A0A2A6BC33_PRIPA|eukprot:PDM63443.1 hypothetical protein PRIPAC_53800 [Pristionchus pacificus]
MKPRKRQPCSTTYSIVFLISSTIKSIPIHLCNVLDPLDEDEWTQERPRPYTEAKACSSAFEPAPPNADVTSYLQLAFIRAMKSIIIWRLRGVQAKDNGGCGI